MTKKSLFIFLLALIIRLVGLIALPHIPIPSDTVGGYESYAQNLLKGNGYITDEGYRATRAPLYSFFLAGTHLLFGENFLFVKLLQIFLDAITCLVVFTIAATILHGRIGFWAGIASALYPPQIYLSLTVCTEPLYTFLLSGSMLALVLGITKDSRTYILTAGLLFGLSALCRPVILGYPFIMALALLLLKPVQNRFLFAGLLICSFLFVVTPWVMRNYQIFHTFIPISTGGGVSFAQGSSFEYMVPTDEKVKTGNADLQRIGIDRSNWKNEVEQDAGHRILALKNYQEMLNKQPFNIILLTGYKFIRFWYATDSGRNQLAFILIHLPIVLLALLGIVHIVKQGISCSFVAVLLLVGYAVALHTIMFPLVRYAIPVMPYVLIFTIIGFERMRIALK